MSIYDNFQSLNDLDVATPLDGASAHELALALRQLKSIVKTVVLNSMNPDGTLRAIGSVGLSNGSVGFDQLMDDSVGTVKLRDASVTQPKLGLSAVEAANLATGAVTESKYAANSIPGNAFKEGSIPLAALGAQLTRAFLSSSTDTDSLRSVTADHIANLAVTDRAVNDVGIAKLTGGADAQFLYKVDGVWIGVSTTGALTYNAITNQFEVASPLSIALIGDQKAQGTGGGTSAADTWTGRSLGEISDVDNIISWSGNSFQLIPGSYQLFIRCPAQNVGKHQTRLLVDKADSFGFVPFAWGSTASATGVGVQTDSVIQHAFVHTNAAWVFKLQHYTQLTNNSSDLGLPASSNTSDGLVGYTEVYTTGYIIKLK